MSSCPSLGRRYALTRGWLSGYSVCGFFMNTRTRGLVCPTTRLRLVADNVLPDNISGALVLAPGTTNKNERVTEQEGRCDIGTVSCAYDVI